MRPDRTSPSDPENVALHANAQIRHMIRFMRQHIGGISGMTTQY